MRGTIATVTTVDTHAHVFLRDLAMAPGRRYSPQQDAPLVDYLAMLDRHVVDFGVLIQPSFLGTDNSYMVACLKAAAGRLRGVAVVEPDISDDELARLDAAGVVGIRFNLLGRPRPVRLTVAELALSRRVAKLGWQIEVQADSPDLASLLPWLAALQTPVVIDHFGRPDAELGLWCPGFQAILAAPTNVNVKISAPYRLATDDVGVYLNELVAALGPDRLLWGSDWPWTQHETGRDYGALLAIANTLAQADRIHANAARLFRFAAG